MLIASCQLTEVVDSTYQLTEVHLAGQILQKVDRDGDSELSLSEFLLFVEVRSKPDPDICIRSHLCQVCKELNGIADLSLVSTSPLPSVEPVKSPIHNRVSSADSPRLWLQQPKEAPSRQGFFKGKALPKLALKRVKNEWDPLPSDTKEEAQIRWRKNEWDRLGPGVDGPVVTSYDRPDLGHGEGVQRDISRLEWEKVNLRKMQESPRDDDYADFDPQLVLMFKMLDANNSKSVCVSELIASMKDIRDALGLQHPSSVGDITKVLHASDQF